MNFNVLSKTIDAVNDMLEDKVTVDIILTTEEVADPFDQLIMEDGKITIKLNMNESFEEISELLIHELAHVLKAQVAEDDEDDHDNSYFERFEVIYEVFENEFKKEIMVK